MLWYSEIDEANEDRITMTHSRHPDRFEAEEEAAKLPRPLNAWVERWPAGGWIVMFEVRVGTPATEHVGSDCYPFEVVGWTASGKTLKLQRVHHGPNTIGKGIPGIDAEGLPGDFIHPGAPPHKARWSEKRKRYTTKGRGISLGHARYYMDPHF